MSSSSNKARLESLKRQLKRLEDRRAAEVARTREDLGEGMTIDAITKLSVFSKTDLKKMRVSLSLKQRRRRKPDLLFRLPMLPLSARKRRRRRMAHGLNTLITANSRDTVLLTMTLRET